MVQFASVHCSKDAFQLMNSACMPTVKNQTKEVEEGAIVAIYHSKNVRNCCQSSMVHRTMREETMHFGTHNGKVSMSHAHGEGPTPFAGSLQNLNDNKKFQSMPRFELRAKVATKRFNSLFMGDLAFLCVLVGMEGSDEAHCLLCQRKAAEFNCNCQLNDSTTRTKESLVECLMKHREACDKSAAKKPPANHRGANNIGLWDIDPQRIIVPLLHCPVGPVDEVLETFQDWVNLEVETLGSEEDSDIRNEYKKAKATLEERERNHNNAKQPKKDNPDNQEAKKLEKEADKQRKEASKNKAKAKEKYDDMIGKHNAKKSSLKQKFEGVHRNNGIKREHYHGGKFNGVNCIRIMDKSDVVFVGTDEKEGFCHKCVKQKVDTITDEEVLSKIKDYAHLLSTLDSIWSKARGLEYGLLPTDEQVEELDKAIAAGKVKWLQMGIGTRQPKWHLTFDGHLLEQVKKYGGLADKADDSIEKFHQVPKELRTRFRSIPSYENKERCIRRELRRKKSPEIQAQVDKYESKKRKQSAGTKRKREAVERQLALKKAKQEKMEAAIA